MNLNFKKLHPDAKVPMYAHSHDAGFDMYATEDVHFEAGAKMRVPTGIALEIPDGYVGLVWDKSSISFNHGLKTMGGVIDAGYRGEIIIGLYNFSVTPYTIKKGEKVAQILIQKIEHVTFLEAEELSDTTRGESGWGSTGKA
jgi:dUTP pyrophosphatase